MFSLQKKYHNRKYIFKGIKTPTQSTENQFSFGKAGNISSKGELTLIATPVTGTNSLDRINLVFLLTWLTHIPCLTHSEWPLCLTNFAFLYIPFWISANLTVRQGSTTQSSRQVNKTTHRVDSSLPHLTNIYTVTTHHTVLVRAGRDTGAATLHLL